MKNPSFTTSINGNPHFAAYITPKEASFLRALGGGITKDGGQLYHKGLPAFDSEVDENDQNEMGGEINADSSQDTTDPSTAGAGSVGNDGLNGSDEDDATDPGAKALNEFSVTGHRGVMSPESQREYAAQREREASLMGEFVGDLNEFFGFDRNHGYGGIAGGAGPDGSWDAGRPAIGFGSATPAAGTAIDPKDTALQAAINMYGLQGIKGLTVEGLNHITGARHANNPTRAETLTNQNTWGAFAEAQPFWGGVADAIASPIGQALSFGLGMVAPGFGTPFGLAANRDKIASYLEENMPQSIKDFIADNPSPEGLGTGTNDQQDQGNEGVWSEGQQPGMQRTTAVGSSGDDTLSNAQKAAYVKALNNPGVPWSDALKEKLDFSGTPFIGHSGSYRPYAGDYLTYGLGGGHNFYGGPV